jgi:hypothetical protein
MTFECTTDFGANYVLTESLLIIVPNALWLTGIIFGLLFISVEFNKLLFSLIEQNTVEPIEFVWMLAT